MLAYKFGEIFKLHVFIITITRENGFRMRINKYMYAYGKGCANFKTLAEVAVCKHPQSSKKQDRASNINLGSD